MIRYALTTYAGIVEVALDVDAPGAHGELTLTGPAAALPHVRRDIMHSYGSDGHLLDGPVSANDLRVAMGGPVLRAYQPKLVE